MRNILLLLNILLITFSVFSQMPIPYHEAFEDETFYNTNPPKYMDIAGPNYLDGPDANPGLYQTVINDAKNYSWEISPNYLNSSNSLKLTVHEADKPHIGTIPINGRSRAEFSVKSRSYDNDIHYYSFNFYVPVNSEFTEENSGWNMISQILGSNKILEIDYVHNPSLSNNVKRDLFILIHGLDGNKHSRIHVDSVIQKGQWNEIILQIQWKNDNIGNPNDNGRLGIWYNRHPVTINSEPTEDPDGPMNYNCILGHTSQSPYLIPFKNINSSNFTDYNFKIGHYRGDQVNTNSIYFDDLRFDTEFPPEKGTTKIREKYCNTTLTHENSILKIFKVEEAVEYVAEFEYSGIKTYAGMGTSTQLYLNYVNSLEAGKVYNVKVRPSGVENSSYGESCEILIPNRTKLKDEFCNETVSVSNNTIGIYQIRGATEYVAEFERNGIKTYAGMGNSTFLDLDNVNSLQIGETYNVRIRAKGVYNSGYGESCSITLSPSYFKTVDKSINISNDKSKIYPNPFRNEITIQGIDGDYTYRLIDSNGNTLESGNQSFNSKLNFVDIQLQSGVYYLEIKSENANKTYKLLKE